MGDLKSKLIGERGAGFPTQTMNIDGVGLITFRALSRAEVLNARTGNEGKSTLEIERVFVSMAMLDPKLTVDDVAAWQENSPLGELERVTRAIMTLSNGGNLTPDGEAGKEAVNAAYKSVRG